jgi:hypothetical protein
MNPVHVAQLVTYLKLTGAPAGLLLNFNACTLKAGLRRASHPDVHALRMRRLADGRRAPVGIEVDVEKLREREAAKHEGSDHPERKKTS